MSEVETVSIKLGKIKIVMPINFKNALNASVYHFDELFLSLFRLPIVT